MQPESKKFDVTMGDRQMSFETGRLAMQAGGAVTLRLGDSMVFAAATMSSEIRPGIDFLPLTVDYEERMYAGGRIPGSFFRREGRPTEEAILTSRLTDRPLRPLFPKDLRNDVQVIVYSLSIDNENPIDILAVNAASAALMISDIPWGGPIGAVRVGRVDGQFIINPTFQEQEKSDLDLRLAGTKDAILMVECGAKEVGETDMIAALEFGHLALQPIIEAQEKMALEVGKPKRPYTPYATDETLKQKVFDRVQARLNEILSQPYERVERGTALHNLSVEVAAEYAEPAEGQAVDPALQLEVQASYEDAYKQVMRQRILDLGQRVDGRSVTQIRPIWCDVNVSPRAHGSGLFTRGETQV